MTSFRFTEDAFGDHFDLSQLSLPRPPGGYAVQMLDTDQLLDQISGIFLPVRHSKLSGLFDTFDQAYAAAQQWVEAHGIAPDEHRLAIVPASFDEKLERHVLIYGVLCGQP